MRSRGTPPDSLSASDPAKTDDPASITTGTNARRGVPRLLGAGTVAGVTGCLGGDEEQTDNDFSEGVRFGGGWRTYVHDDTNTTFFRDETAISESTIEYEPDLGISSTGPVATNGVAYTPSDPIRAPDPAADGGLWTAQGEGWATPVILDGIIYLLDVTVHSPNRPALHRTRTGRLFQTIKLPGHPWTPPAFSNGRKMLFLGLNDERVCTVDTGAAEARQARSSFDMVRRFLAVNPHSILMITEGQRLYYLGADGRTRWQTLTETVETIAPVIDDERMYIADWDRIAALERRNGDVVRENDRGVRERLAFDGDRLYVVRESFRAPDSVTGEERWCYDPEETISVVSVIGDAVYVDMRYGDLVVPNRIGNGGLFSDHERQSISLGRNVGHSLAVTNRWVLCPPTHDDGLSSITVVVDADESSAGVTADTDGSEP